MTRFSHSSCTAASGIGYPIAIVHSIDRQRYYEALRGDHLGLTSLYLEAVQTTAETEMRVYDEASKGPTKKRAKKSSSGTPTT